LVCSDSCMDVLSDPAIIWYQRFDLAPGATTPGHHDIEATMRAARVPNDLSGRRVLDIGTCNGGAAFVAERRGAARVVGVDIYEPTVFGFQQIAAEIGSTAEFKRATVYDLPQVLGCEFDAVFFFGVLYHLRHPLLAIDALHQLTRGTLHIETAVSGAESGAEFYPDQYAGDSSNWFVPSAKCVLDWLRSSGFDAECTSPCSFGDSQRATFVAQRSAALPSWRRASYELPVSVSIDWTAATWLSTVTEAALPYPPLDLIERLSGQRDTALYEAQGVQSLNDWGRALAAIGHSWSDFTSILDFGCGAGRVARQMGDLAATASFIGVDTDKEAIAWCSDNIAWMRFLAVHPMPPMPLGDSSFDLIVNHSVFTHMPEDVQDAWLAELQRVLRPGGVALLTVNGEHPMAHLESTWREAGADPSAIRQEFDEHGLLFVADDSWNDPQFDGHFPSYYHSTFHSTAYVERHWAKFFRVRGVLFGAALGWQSIVILETL